MPSQPPDLDAIFGPIRQAAADRPFVIAQLGQSLDGRIATVTGQSRWINGAGAIDHLHRLRAAVDAIILGCGTVIADDPLLTVRRVSGRNPARAVIDPNGRVPASAKVFSDDGVRRIVIGGARPAIPNVEHIDAPQRNGAINPAAIIEALFAKGLRRILVEGGASTVSRFIDARAVDRLHVLVAPVIIGSGLPGLSLAPIARLDDALRPVTRVHILDACDVLFDCDLRQQSGKR